MITEGHAKLMEFGPPRAVLADLDSERLAEGLGIAVTSGLLRNYDYIGSHRDVRFNACCDEDRSLGTLGIVGH